MNKSIKIPYSTSSSAIFQGINALKSSTPVRQSKTIKSSISETRFLSDKVYNLESLRRNYRILYSITQLEENWNGYHAESIPLDIVNKVKGLLGSLEVQPKIFPTARKSIQLEYEKENEDYLEFEFFEDSIICFMEINQQETETKLDKPDIPDVVHEFYAG